MLPSRWNSSSLGQPGLSCPLQSALLPVGTAGHVLVSPRLPKLFVITPGPPVSLCPSPHSSFYLWCPFCTTPLLSHLACLAGWNSGHRSWEQMGALHLLAACAQPPWGRSWQVSCQFPDSLSDPLWVTISSQGLLCAERLGNSLCSPSGLPHAGGWLLRCWWAFSPLSCLSGSVVPRPCTVAP